jgi:hypothetical protein
MEGEWEIDQGGEERDIVAGLEIRHVDCATTSSSDKECVPSGGHGSRWLPVRARHGRFDIKKDDAFNVRGLALIVP